MGASITLPVVGDPGSAKITGPTIDHEELAMRTEIHRYIDEAEDFELDPCLSHQVHSAAMNAIAAQGVLEKVHFHPSPSALCQGFGKRIRYFALFKEEVFKCYCALRGTYRLEQSRENLIAIFQGGHFVAFQQRRTEQISHGSDEDIVPDCVVSDDFMMDLLLSREEIAGDKERCRSANRGGTKGGRPS
jgi:AraC-like DNA-binding protein